MKFKNIPTKKSKNYSKKPAIKSKEGRGARSQEFPNIYRFITEKVYLLKPKKMMFRLINQPKLNKILKIISVFFVILIVILLSFGIIVFGIRFYKNYQDFRKISVQRENLQSQINFWQSIADKYPGYKDAYFRIAILQYQLGNFQKSKDANIKALLLDPNFDDAKNLEVILEKK